MSSKLELFSTKECKRCVKLSDYLSAKGIKFQKRVIDIDPEAETDAIMLDIFAAPALRSGDKVLFSKDLFPTIEDELNKDRLHTFLGV